MRKSICLAASLVMASMLWLVPSAGATSTTIGQVAPAGTSGGCSECSALQLAVAPGTPSYVVPPLPAGETSWTLTSWSARADTTHSGTGRALVWRPTGISGEFRLLAETAEMNFPQGQAPTFTASVPVLPGDVLGLKTGDANDILEVYDATAQDEDLAASGNPQVGQTVGGPMSDVPSFTNAGVRVNVAATLTSTSAPAHKRKCNKKKHKRSAASAKKKKCKKHKKK